MNYSEKSTPELIKEINQFDAKIPKLKTQGGLWATEMGIRAIRAELDKRIKDPALVTKMILEAKN